MIEGGIRSFDHMQDDVRQPECCTSCEGMGQIAFVYSQVLSTLEGQISRHLKLLF